jgi:hypothetical protein
LSPAVDWSHGQGAGAKHDETPLPGTVLDHHLLICASADTTGTTNTALQWKSRSQFLVALGVHLLAILYL